VHNTTAKLLRHRYAVIGPIIEEHGVIHKATTTHGQYNVKLLRVVPDIMRANRQTDSCKQRHADHNTKQEAFEKCRAHSPLRAAARRDVHNNNA